MGLPLTFLAGLAVLLLHDQINDRLPGAESLARLFMQLLIGLVPWLLAHLIARRVGRVVLRGAVPGRLLQAALRLPGATVPAAYAVMVIGGELPDFVEIVARDLYVLRVVILLAPLLAMDISVRIAERRTARWLELAGLATPIHLGLDRLRMVGFLIVPILLFAGATDLLGQDRRLQVFFGGTALGASIGMIGMVVVLCVLLPLLFRMLLPVSRSLPDHLAEGLRATAARLGFPRTALLSMNTRHRLVNAALVGPFRWPRYLVLTDGLMSLLDEGALRGVVAHEVGHAKANHPAWLVLIFAGIPLLLLSPLERIGIAEMEPTVLVGTLGGLGLAAWYSLRKLAHRFEFEADQLSAEALGGAEPCVRALRRVGELAPRRQRRASFRHPSEERRIQHLFACEGDVDYRNRFWHRGRVVRRAVCVVLLGALGLFSWAQVSLWRTDRAIYLYYVGRVQEARQALDLLPADLPPSERELTDELRSEIEATLALGFPAGDWNEMREDLAGRALARGRSVLETERDAAAALPWFSLATYARDAEPWVVCMYRYCRAVAAEDTAEAERVRAHLERIEVPADVKF